MSRSSSAKRALRLPAAAFLQLAACAISANVGPKPRRFSPPRSVDHRPAGQLSQQPRAPPRPRPLQRIDLRAAITRPPRRPPPIAPARAEVARAQGLLRQARAGMFPVLNANAAYTRLDEERRAAGQRVAARDQLGAELQLSVPLVVPQRWVEAGQAADRVELARHDGAADRMDLTMSVAQAYLTVMAQHRVIEVNERALANARAHYDFAHTRFTGGIGNQIDDVRAGQEAATSIADWSDRSRTWCERKRRSVCCWDTWRAGCGR